MKLTKKRAMKICIELWSWLAETGGHKEDWPKWEEYGEMRLDCPLCEYNKRNPIARRVDCNCPLAQPPFNGCFDPPSKFINWYNASGKEKRQKAAKAFLKQLKQVKEGK